MVGYLLEDDVGVTPADTLDGGHGEHDVPLAINVGVHHTQNVLEVGRDDQRHLGRDGGCQTKGKVNLEIDRCIIKQ